MKTLTDTMDFGKYSDKTVKWVIDNDLYYFEWVLDEVESFEIDVEAYAYYDEQAYYCDADYEDCS